MEGVGASLLNVALRRLADRSPDTSRFLAALRAVFLHGETPVSPTLFPFESHNAKKNPITFVMG